MMMTRYSAGRVDRGKRSFSFCRSSRKNRRVLFAGLLMLFAVLVQALCPGSSLAEEPLTLGVYPFLASAEIYKRFTPLADYLSKELGRPVAIHIESTYDSHIHLVGTGGVDFAFLGPASYVKLTGKFGAFPLLAVYETEGSATYKGVIMVRQDSPIKTLSQLKGKRFAFGDINSTMSHLVPRYMLQKAGITVKDLGSYDFLANHENVVMGVLSGTYDAGAVREPVYQLYAAEGLRVVAASEPMPDHLFVARRGLPPDTVRKLSESLLSLKDSEEGKMVLRSLQKSLTALVPVRDKDYDKLRKVVEALRKAGVNP